MKYESKDILAPGRYVGAEEEEDDVEDFEEKMEQLFSKLNKQFQESTKIEEDITKNLKMLGYGE